MDLPDALELIASLEGYLHDLRDTGVEGLPLGSVISPHKAAAPLAAAVRPSPAPPKPVVLEPSVVSVAADQGGGIKAVREELGDCRRCSLGATRTKLLFGAGNLAARLVFVGDAPGGEDEQQGIPFADEAGELLTKIIQAMGFRRDEIYLCNVIKCRPPHDRDPQHDEIRECYPFLLKQLQAIGPEVVVTLGTFASQTLLRTKEPISKLRGVFHDYHGMTIMPTFHPAYLLRNGAMKREVWADMQKVMKRLGVEAPVKR